MKIVTADQMRDLERRAADIGLPPAVLMEKAGLAVAREVRRLLGQVVGSSILILVGPGNNGGDGLVAARHLHDWGARVNLYLCGRRTEADDNLRLTRGRGIIVIDAGTDDDLSALDGVLSSAEVVIDALFGTGKLRPLEGAIRSVLERVRRYQEARPGLAVVALDLPSGLDADGGAVDAACLSADMTVTLGCPKVGLFAFPGSEKVGRLAVADIGLPPNLIEGVRVELITADWARSMLPPRPLDANKGTFGKVLVAAGSINYVGAAYLASAAAARIGAGLVTLAIAQSLQPILATKLTEVTYVPLPEAEPGIIHARAAKVLLECLAEYDVLLLGCGLGQHPAMADFVRASLFSLPPASSPGLVLDADGLNALAQTPNWWQNLGRGAVLTPHPGEMARLTGVTVPEVQRDRLGIASRFATEWGQTVVLKGAHTVVAEPEGQVKLSPVANPGLASAGTGDVLSGVIAGLLAQGLSPFAAAGCGVYLHGMAGEMVKGEVGDTGMVASDLLPKLPLAIKKLRERTDQ